MSLYDENDESQYDDDGPLSPEMQAVAVGLEEDEVTLFNQDTVEGVGAHQIGMGTGRDERVEWLTKDEEAANAAAEAA